MPALGQGVLKPHVAERQEKRKRQRVFGYRRYAGSRRGKQNVAATCMIDWHTTATNSEPLFHRRSWRTEMSTIEQRAAQWIVGRDTGSSSKALWATMMGATSDKSHPHDGADLGRCLRLLEAIPEWKPRVGEMSAVSEYWAALVPHWDDLAKLHATASERSSTVYDRMREILDPVEKRDRQVVRVGNVSVHFGS